MRAVINGIPKITSFQEDRNREGPVNLLGVAIDRALEIEAQKLKAKEDRRLKVEPSRREHHSP